MSTARPFAYNTGSIIAGTTQVGSLHPQDLNGGKDPMKSWVM